MFTYFPPVQSYLGPQPFVHDGHFLFCVFVSFGCAALSMKTQVSRMHSGPLDPLNVLVLGLYCTVKSGLLVRAVKTVKLRAVQERSRAPLHLEQTPKAAVFSVYSIHIVFLQGAHADVILPVSVHCSHGQEELQELGGIRSQQLFHSTVSQQSDVLLRVEDVWLPLLRRHALAGRLVPVIVVGTTSLRLTGVVEWVREHRPLSGLLVPQAVGWRESP